MLHTRTRLCIFDCLKDGAGAAPARLRPTQKSAQAPLYCKIGGSATLIETRPKKMAAAQH